MPQPTAPTARICFHRPPPPPPPDMSRRLLRLGRARRRVWHRRLWAARDAETLRAVFVEDDLRCAMIERGVVGLGRTIDELRSRLHLDEALIVAAYEDGASLVVLRVEWLAVLRLRAVVGWR